MQRPPSSPGENMPGVEFAQPTLLRTRSRTQSRLIDVAVTPMVPEGQHLGRREVRLDIEGPEVIVLRPLPPRSPWVNKVIFVLLLASFGMVAALAGRMAYLHGLARNWSLCGIWSLFTLFPLSFIVAVICYPFFHRGPLRVYFDRRAQLFMLQRTIGIDPTPRTEATYMMASVVAVQLLYRYYTAASAGVHDPAALDPKRRSYEMNLVMDDPREPRIHLAVHGDPKWMRNAGRRLADYLNVPVMDQLCLTD